MLCSCSVLESVREIILRTHGLAVSHVGLIVDASIGASEGMVGSGRCAQKNISQRCPRCCQHEF